MKHVTRDDIEAVRVEPNGHYAAFMDLKALTIELVKERDWLQDLIRTHRCTDNPMGEPFRIKD